MAWCLTAPSHYPYQCWLIIKDVLWHSPESIFTRGPHELNPKHVLGDYTSKITTTSPTAIELIIKTAASLMHVTCTCNWVKNSMVVILFTPTCETAKLGSSDAISIWRYRSWSTLIHVMTCQPTGDKLLVTSHYLNQWRIIVSWTTRNKLHWNLNQYSNIFHQENAF